MLAHLSTLYLLVICTSVAAKKANVGCVYFWKENDENVTARPILKSGNACQDAENVDECYRELAKLNPVTDCCRASYNGCNYRADTRETLKYCYTHHPWHCTRYGDSADYIKYKVGQKGPCPRREFIPYTPPKAKLERGEADEMSFLNKEEIEAELRAAEENRKYAERDMQEATARIKRLKQTLEVFDDDSKMDQVVKQIKNLAEIEAAHYAEIEKFEIKASAETGSSTVIFGLWARCKNREFRTKISNVHMTEVDPATRVMSRVKIFLEACKYDVPVEYAV